MEDNDKDDNNFKDISALGLDRDLEFSREHPTKSTLTIPNQTKPKPTKPYQMMMTTKTTTTTTTTKMTTMANVYRPLGFL